MKMQKNSKRQLGRFESWDMGFLLKDLSRDEVEAWVKIIQNKVEKEYYKGSDHDKSDDKNKDYKMSDKNKDGDKDKENNKYKESNNNKKYREILRNGIENKIKCPKCSHTDLSKNGITNSRQRYICKNCRTTFDERSFSPLSNTKLSLDKWLKYCRLMVEGGTIKYCAEKVDVSVPTSFFMRHRILDVLNLALRNQIFEGIVAADDYNLNESFKGKSHKKSINEDRYFYNFKYSDLARCVGWTFRNSSKSVKHPERGIKPIQVKINTAIDKNGHILTRIVENPHFQVENNKNYAQLENKKKYQDIFAFFDGKLDKNATLCAFNSGLYREVAHKLNVKFKKAKSRMTEPVYSVKHVLMYHIKLSKWLTNFNGVATKYLNNYLAWYSFLTIMKKFDGIKILKKLFTQITTTQLCITKQQIQDRKIEAV